VVRIELEGVRKREKETGKKC